MGKVPMLLATSVLAAVFGCLGAIGGVVAFGDDLKGDQGASGLQGPPGEVGPEAADGSDGVDGARGPRGLPGKAARAPQPRTFDLGTADCAGQPFEVVTDVTVVRQQVRVSKAQLCVITP